MSKSTRANEGFSDQSSEQDDSEQGLLRRTTKQRKTWWPSGIYLLAGAQTTVICFLLLTIILLRGNDQCQSYFRTDLTHLEDIVGFKERSFTNPLQPSKDLSTWEVWTDEPEWVGPPREEIDHAWEDLLSVVTFNRTSAAAKYADGKAYQYSDGNYIMGFEVYHGLHCVDTLRKFLYPERYEQKDPEDQQTLHKQHCVDYLRQYIQCNADLSPMWASWNDAYGLVVTPYTPHTCRDFGALHRWILDGDA